MEDQTKIDDVRRRVNNQGLTEEETRDRVKWRKFLGLGKPKWRSFGLIKKIEYKKLCSMKKLLCPSVPAGCEIG